MDDAKKTYRQVETDVREKARDLDGHTLKDDIGNAGDRLRRDLGNAGDDLRHPDRDHRDAERITDRP